MTISECERILDTYSLEEILEMNECTEAEMLFFLVEEKFITLPSYKPTDVVL